MSDLHVADVEDHDDGWRSHKSSRFVFDDDFAALVARFLASGRGGGPRTLVLNGDIFDFDIVTAVPEKPPWPVSPVEKERGLDATEPKSAWKLSYILGHHPVFVATLAELAMAGHRIVYVLGNHDREFHFPEVQRTLVAALQQHAERQGGRLPDGAIRFEPWFYYVPGELYAEHGNQFDHYASFRDVLSPTFDGHEGPTIAVPMGDLSNRYIGTQLGYFNPHAADFILNFFRYITHWFEHYAFTHHSLFGSFLMGSFLVVVRLLDVKKQLILRRRDEAAVAQVARRYNLSVATLDSIASLHKPPIGYRIYRVLREFWMDRLFLLVALASGTVALDVSSAPFWAKVFVPLMGVPLVFFLYEWAVRGDTIFTVDEQIPGSARAIATMLPVRVVTFGHTHKPRLIALHHGATFVDTGAWAPITSREQRKTLVPGFRNYLQVDFEEAEPRIVFDCWPVGAATAAAANQDAEATRAAVERAAG